MGILCCVAFRLRLRLVFAYLGDLGTAGTKKGCKVGDKGCILGVKSNIVMVYKYSSFSRSMPKDSDKLNISTKAEEFWQCQRYLLYGCMCGSADGS